ncbi:hypothetical protein RV10_GL001631 [Enterococcus pallens]|nr:hypothetical protein RV10_GL001631 [Enterococcus pallens]
MKKMCYLDESGNGMPSLKHAKKHENKEMAELVAETCGGRVVELIDQKDAVKVRKKMQSKKAPTKLNQSWMRQKG